MKNSTTNLNLSPADFWTRAIAFIVDLIIIRILWAIWLYCFPPETNSGSYGITFLIYLTYFTLTEGILGKTAGMAIFGLKVVSADTKEKINIPYALSRSIGRILCTLTVGIGYLTAFTDKNKQALHDRYSKTIVVYK